MKENIENADSEIFRRMYDLSCKNCGSIHSVEVKFVNEKVIYYFECSCCGAVNDKNKS